MGSWNNMEQPEQQEEQGTKAESLPTNPSVSSAGTTFWKGKTGHGGQYTAFFLMAKNWYSESGKI